MFGDPLEKFKELQETLNESDRLRQFVCTFPSQRFSYKCPKCGGEFDLWELRPEKPRVGVKQKKCCPFCLTAQGEFKKEIK